MKKAPRYMIIALCICTVIALFILMGAVPYFLKSVLVVAIAAGVAYVACQLLQRLLFQGLLRMPHDTARLLSIGTTVSAIVSLLMQL